MKRIKLYEADDHMVSLIRDNYNVLQAMGAFGINLGFGDKTVQQVCQEQQVDTYTFLLVMNYLINGYRHQGPDESVSVATLMHYLRASHEYFLGFQLPFVRRSLAEAFAEDSRMQAPVLQLYDEYAHTVVTHMKYEEKMLFPYVERLLAGEKMPNYDAVTFSRHHEDTTAQLQEMKSVIVRYIPTNVLTNNKLMAALYHLYDIEQWLHAHANVEDDIFVPAISHLEQQLSQQNVPLGALEISTLSTTEDSLSKREKDVIVCLAQGMANKEIADSLCISVHTVTTHRRNIARKLDIHSPAGLIVYAIVHNLLDIASVNALPTHDWRK